MNMDIANRLYEFRKRKGFSQEELANELNLSRQAISKWERGEASPDTENLISLSKLYGVTLDDLVNVDKSVDDVYKGKEEKNASKQETNKEPDQEVLESGIKIDKDGIKITSNEHEEVNIDSNGVFVDGKNIKKAIIKHPFVDALFSIFILLILVGYLLLGFLCTETFGVYNVGAWGAFWPAFIFAPVIPSLIKAIVYRNANDFAMPLLVTSAFCQLGMLYGVWHPLWLMFLIIPIYYTIVNTIKKSLRN